MSLDYDGTLMPIVNNPDEAFMSPQVHESYSESAKHFNTVIVSGRCVDKVRTFVNVPQLHYAGSHRLDLKGPNQGEIYQPHEFLKFIADVFNELTKKTQSILGCLVENNRFSVAVHFRCVAEDKWNNIAELVDSVLNTYTNLRLLRGRMVLEIRPKINWNKGNVVDPDLLVGNFM
ncbi:Probable trehalose-phosphate phosphatase 8 [Linum perenne]